MATTSMEDLVQRLPHDVLADVLRRLETTPRLLAASRCVCKTWRAVVNTRGLLRADLLPLSLAGIFTHPGDETLPEYFALPHQSSTEIAAAALDDPDTDRVGPLMVVQHCNGLLLLGNGESSKVLNPATGQWACLPSPPPLRLLGTDDVYGYQDLYEYEYEDGFLVFDHTISPHYQVLLIKSIPFVPWPDCQVVKPSTKAREWPPSPYTLRVFSSKTRLWEKKQFMRQGEARGTVEDMLWCPSPNYCYGAYWQGALYVHQRDFVMRMNLSDYTYQVIKLPKCDLEWADWYLGKSNGGVYCALFKGYGAFGLQVWFLDETCGQMKWDLKRDVDLHPLLATLPDHGEAIRCAHLDYEDDMRNGTRGVSVENYVRRTRSILGFHPNEEIVFIHTPAKRVMSYQFNNSEAEDLGYLPMDEVRRHRIHCSFPYTPCRMGQLSSNMYHPD